MASLAQNVFGNNRTYPPGTPVMLGIDEAGRGPVLGPMVYGCAYCPLSREKDLKSSGYADSKTLSEEQRENLFEKICACDYVGWSVEVISAARLSEHMLRVKKYNLNLISHDSAAGLVRRTLALGVNVCKVFVDTVGDPEKYQAKLSGMFPSIEFKVAKKADSLFPCVSAASICAKVVRDRDIKAWRPSESNQGHTAVALGSGYPADPFTKVMSTLVSLLARSAPYFNCVSLTVRPGCDRISTPCLVFLV
jgi:ribonuclease H2 subunit A